MTGSASTENFIKTVYKYELKEGSDVKSGSIARELGITHAAWLIIKNTRN